MSKASNEATKPYDFKADILCMTAGLINNGQPLKTVTEMEKNGKNMNYVLKENEIALSHEDCQRKTHTQSKKKSAKICFSRKRGGVGSCTQPKERKVL